jgi:hypothetical protein
MLRTTTATRYVTPLREGGSLPAIIEADDDGLYVIKFRGAGQGLKALIAELVGGEIARALGLPVPEIVFMELDPTLGRSEPDVEIQALIKASAGLNLALDYLPGALMFDAIDPRLSGYQERSQTPFTPIKDHVLLPVASMLEEADHNSKQRLTPEVVHQIVSMIPDLWLENDPPFPNQDAHRVAYTDYLLDRLAHSHIFIEEALRARDQLV